MLSVIGGLTVMLGSSPLAAQGTPSATRSFDSSIVAPDGMVTVTITLVDAGALTTVTETLPTGFTYVSGSSSLPDQVEPTGQSIDFVPLGETNEFTYQATASSAEGTYSFSGTVNVSPTEQPAIGGDSEITVGTDGTTPDPTATATPDALPIPDLDNLTDAQAQAIFSATDGNSVEYTAEGADDAKIVARVSPDTEAIITIDLGITVPAGQQINFSLTDGADFGFQIKKTGDATAMIVAKEDVGLTSGQYNFELVVNEFDNAPANSSGDRH